MPRNVYVSLDDCKEIWIKRKRNFAFPVHIKENIHDKLGLLPFLFSNDKKL